MKLQKIEAVCASGLFLALAILETITAACSLPGGSVPVFPILFSIGLWMVWAAARAGKMTERRSGASMVSGTAKALHIVNWVAIGFLCFAAVIFLILTPFFTDESMLHDELVQEVLAESEADVSVSAQVNGVAILKTGYARDAQGYINGLEFGTSDGMTFTMSFAVFFGAFGAVILLFAVCYMLINIFFFRNLHKFTKSLCVSFETGTPALVKVGMLRVWFLVLAILNSIGFLDVFADASLLPILKEGCGCAVLYVIFVLFCRLLAIENSPEEPTDVPLPEQI